MSIKPAYMTATLAKGLDVLEALSDVEDTGLTELARRQGVSGPTLFRILATLAAHGYVAKSPGGRYRLTLKTWEIGAKAVRRLPLRDLARPLMERMTAETGETVHLSVPRGTAIVVIDKVDSPHPVRVDTFVGLSAPAHCSATGKALLAVQPPASLEKLLPVRLTRYTDATLTDRTALLRELAQVRRVGWARNREEWRPGVCAAAVVLRDAAGEPVASLSVTVPTSRFTSEAVRERLVPALKRYGRAIEAQLARTGR
ncbi:MAG TPA: IclR family transcriptional regulator [Verrucomicrobiae bacterium]|jgi:IclR family KDG regulon transcriptional repressor|nr:IclR family transcriptional regulator [Verrucomicrobiae bacterium]